MKHPLPLLAAALLLSACVSQPRSSRVYTIEELAREALPAIAHIDTPTGTGTGFLLAPHGWVVTNFHVLMGNDSAKVHLGDQVYTDLTVIAANAKTDLAVLQLPEARRGGLPLVRNIDDVHLGEQVIALGNPRGLRGTLSHGLVSTVAREIPGLPFMPIQTTAAISGGSSGGPLLNLRGQVIGITSFTYKDGQNLNFAVPADLLRELLQSPGPTQTLAQAFGSESPARYRHQPGEFAVKLSWNCDADLDLELWDAQFNYLGDAFAFGDCWDIVDGRTGEEYFVFGGENFNEGQFIISPYFVQGGTGRTTATLTLYFPDGRRQAWEQTLVFDPPGDQWFAIRVDLDTQTVKTLDFFMDAPTIALLEWEGKGDLDLIVYDPQYRRHFRPVHLPGGRDFLNGNHGIEVFRFGEFGEFDFSQGPMDLLVAAFGKQNETQHATLTLLHRGQQITQRRQSFEPPNEPLQFWHAMTFRPETRNIEIPKQTWIPFRTSPQGEIAPGTFSE